MPRNEQAEVQLCHVTSLSSVQTRGRVHFHSSQSGLSGRRDGPAYSSSVYEDPTMQLQLTPPTRLGAPGGVSKHDLRDQTHHPTAVWDSTEASLNSGAGLG